MKKVFLALVATVLMSGASWGAIILDDKNSKQQTKEAVFAAVMVEVVEQAKPYYKSGMSYNDFVSTLNEGKRPSLSSNEDQFLKDVFNYLSSNSSPENIKRSYSGNSFENLLKDKNAFKSLSSQEKRRCNFWCRLGRTFELVGVFIQDIVDIWS